MFVSFISSKDFFSVINRKIVENYKLNLFDLSLDAFEFKIGLGHSWETTPAKTTDVYYGYLATANFNGYKFYTIANTANALVIASSLYLEEVFEGEEHQIFVDCLYAFYLLSFLFVARIKVFPWNSEQEDFNRFIDLFFEFFSVVTIQLKHKISKEHFKKLKKRLMTKLEVFFLMFHFYRRLNQFYSYQSPEKEYFTWLFGERFSSTHKNFLATYTITKNSPIFSLLEEEILFEVAPADIHLKYLFLENDPHEIAIHLIGSIYDKSLLDQKFARLMKNADELDFIIDYVTDPSHFKKGYFVGIQKFMTSLFRGENDEEMEEFNEMMSVIGDDTSQMENLKIPPRIKKESRVMEQLLNFYVTYIGGLSIERAETFFVRMYKPQLLTNLLPLIEIKISTPASIHLYGMQQYFYSKNNFFYSYVNQNVRSGKEKFFVPLDTTSKTIKSNLFSLTMFDEISLLTILQDINPKLWKLYVKNTALLQRFQEKYSKKISEMIRRKSTDFILEFYSSFFSGFSHSSEIITLLQHTLVEQDIVRLKNALYSFDLWIFRAFLEKLSWKKVKIYYTEQALLTLFSLFRELLPWFLLYYHFVQIQNKKSKKSQHPQLLLKIFLLDILGIDSALFPDMKKVIDWLLEEFSFALMLFAEFDDNKAFFYLLWENWKNVVKNKDSSHITLSSEDLLWLRGIFKHITYYNKRYLIPS